MPALLASAGIVSKNRKTWINIEEPGSLLPGSSIMCIKNQNHVVFQLIFTYLLFGVITLTVISILSRGLSLLSLC